MAPAWVVSDARHLAAPASPAEGAEPSAAVDGGEGRSDKADSERVCSICLEKFVVGQRARSLPCRHVFHDECIGEWLTQSSLKCPEDGMPVIECECDGDEAAEEPPV